MEYEQNHTIIIQSNARCVRFLLALTMMKNDSLPLSLDINPMYTVRTSFTMKSIRNLME